MTATATTSSIATAAVPFVQKWEGYKADLYLDAGGVYTIGYGHAVSAGGKFLRKADYAQAKRMYAAPLSKADATVLLVSDLRDVYAGPLLAKLARDGITLPRHDMYVALLSFVFNLGHTALFNSTLYKMMRAGDYLGAAKQFERWSHVGASKVPGLLNRRKAEAAMFLPDYDTVA